MKSKADTMLPDPLGLLSKTVPSTAIASANVEVWHMFEAQLATQPSLYAKFIPEEKAKVGKRAALPAEYGVVETVLGLNVYCRNLESTYKWAWLIGSIREKYFREMLVEGQTAKYLLLENRALYGTDCLYHGY